MRVAFLALPVALVSLVSLVSLAGCYRGRHAPGNAARASMAHATFTRANCALPVEVEITGEAGRVSGRYASDRGRQTVCGLDGPLGQLAIREITFEPYGKGGRTNTKFTIAYAGASATCTSDGEHPLVCSIVPGNLSNEPLRLELSAGCTLGTVKSASQTLDVRTDEESMLGVKTPGVEVAVLDDNGVLLFSKAKGLEQFDVYTRNDARATPAQVIAVAAVHAFNGIVDSPVDCVLH